MSEMTVDSSKRRFLVAMSSTMGGVAAVGAALPFVFSMNPSARALAAGAPVEVDLSKIEPGMKVDVEWRGKPVWVVHRTPEMLELLGKHEDKLTDPHSENTNQQPEYCRNPHRSIKPEYFELKSNLVLLVIIGVTPEGKKELVTVGDGLRESTQSWLDVLRDLAARGLEAGPLLAVGDGVLGFWAALTEVYPETRHQRCWVHKTANVLNALPKSLQGKAKAGLHEIWMAPTRAQAQAAFDAFLKTYQAKYPKATEKLMRDRDALLTFYDFPAEHWMHLRTTNPIESTFATVRHRTTRTRNCVSRATFLGLAFKLVQEAEKSWHRIRGVERIADLMKGIVFKDGIPAPDDLPEQQQMAA